MKLEIIDFSKSFDKKEIFNEVNFTFESGKIYGLIGRNGIGKTTFFNCLNNDISVNSGKFYLEDEFGRDELNYKDIGYITSTPVIPEFLTAREFINFFIEINKDKIKDLKDIDYYLDLVKLSNEDCDKLMKDFSHGMKNKMQILINIIRNPKIILLDEPLTNLDVVVQDDLKKLFKKLKKDHIIIFSTHILELALDLCDDIVIVNKKTLETVEKKSLNTKKYKDKIIKLLKDSNDV